MFQFHILEVHFMEHTGREEAEKEMADHSGDGAGKGGALTEEKSLLGRQSLAIKEFADDKFWSF